MEPLRQKQLARVVLAIFILGCGAWLAHLDFSRKISTNVLDLIPSSEQSPEMKVVRNMAGDVEARIVLFALTSSKSSDPQSLAKEFAAALTRSGSFADISIVGGDESQVSVGQKIFERRFDLLFPSWLSVRRGEFEKTGQPQDQFSPWLAERTARDLESFLSRPEAAAVQDLIPLDPLLLVPGLMDHARALMPAGAATTSTALIWAQTTASPFSEEGQKPVFDAVAGALVSVRQKFPDAHLDWTGVGRFAAASRARIEKEISLLNTLSLLAVLGVSCLFVRKIYKLFHLVPVILISILGAWTVSTLVFERLHILVFVVGSLLSGVAIDYGFYIYMQPFLRPKETYSEKLRRLLKPLLASCLTTVIGFSLLFFSDLPVIRQIGVFVAAGLLCALGAAMLYFAQMERPFLEARQFEPSSDPQRSKWKVILPRILVSLAVTIAVIGPWRLRWKDDIRELDAPSTELNANDQVVRSLFGESSGRTLFLTYGADIVEARDRLQAFLDYLSKNAPTAQASGAGLVLPTQREWTESRSRADDLARFQEDLKGALERHGFDSASFAPFFSSWEKWKKDSASASYASVVASVSQAFKGPLSMLMNANGSPSWFITLVDHGDDLHPPASTQTVGVNQLQSLNALFAQYRWSALRLSLVGLGLVIASVFAIYPFRRGIRIALIPAGSCFFIFGLLGILGQTLNLFHLLGAFLGVCLAHNYAIFSSDNATGRVAPPASIRLSGLCTAASFGVLGCSHLPVIHSLGMTVALIVLTALAVVEIETVYRRSR